LNGKKHGKAIIYSQDGTQEEARFENGERVE
jgi:hypothetical protein